jgi:hypothetical protein
MGLQYVIIETDAHAIVKLMKDHGTSRSLITIIDEQIKELCGCFGRFDSIYVNSLASKATHSSAHRASAARRRCL